MDKKINLRELKKAKTKLLLLDSTINLIGQRSANDLYVEDICQQAEVSKVTFFNYFSQKEDLFSYYMAIWGFHRAVEQHREPLCGMAGVRRIFHRAAEGGARNPGMFLSLIRFLADLKEKPAVPVVTNAEKQVLYPDLNDIDREYPHLYGLFKQFLLEGMEKGEVKRELSIEQLTYMVITMFYGAFLSAHQCGVEDIAAYYDMHLDLLSPS
jgi:AcrR family transcriptional regulator